MRILPVLLTMSAMSPAIAQDAPPLGVSQYGAPVALEEAGEAYVVQIAPGPFTLTFADPVPDVVAVTFGREGLFDSLSSKSEDGLFGTASAYARDPGPNAAHFMTDPLCASTYFGPGYNRLDADRRTDEGYPVAQLLADSRSRRCDVAGQFPTDTDLLGLINPIYAVVRTDAGDTPLIIRFVGS